MVRRLRSRARLTLPRFLGIGAARAGTTWLYANLARHPDLFLPRVKEIHYFDTRYQMPMEWYAAHFLQAEGRVPGEITPNYAVLPASRIRVVHGLMPDARLILMVRDPVERAWSHAVLDFERFGGRSIPDVPERALVDYVRSDRTVRMGTTPPS